MRSIVSAVKTAQRLEKSRHHPTDATFVPRYAKDDIVRSGHMDYNTLYASNEHETGDLTVNLINAPNDSTLQCGCENINCPFCNLMMSIGSSDTTVLQWVATVPTEIIFCDKNHTDWKRTKWFIQSQTWKRFVLNLQREFSCTLWLVLELSDLLIRIFYKNLNGKQLGNIPQEVPCVSCFWRGIVGRTLTEFSALRTLIWAEGGTMESDKNVTASYKIIEYCISV